MDKKYAKCCELGEEYINWFVNKFYWQSGDTVYWTGWGMLVDASHWHDGCSDEVRPIKFCPFCGKKLENKTNE